MIIWLHREVLKSRIWVSASGLSYENNGLLAEDKLCLMKTRNNVFNRHVILAEYEEVGKRCLHKSEKQNKTKNPKERFYRGYKV